GDRHVAFFFAREVRSRAVDAAAHGLAEEEDGVGGAVVGAAGSVLVDAAAELGEDQQRDAVAVALGGEARVEGSERRAEVAQQGGLRALLSGVGVVAVL